MDIRPLNDRFAVTGQIGPDDVAAIAEAGFRAIVCNRPDSEPGAVSHDAVQAAALKAGLEFRFLPVVSGAITAEDVTDMAETLRLLPTPVLAYCRTGGRCANLYGLVQQTGA